MSLFVIGSGPRVGLGIAQKFHAEGYKVAIGSRSPNADKMRSQGFIPIVVDASNMESIEAAFAQVTKELGEAPTVVVYNAVSLTSRPDPQNAFTVPTADFVQDANVNIIGAFVAMREAVLGFDKTNDPTFPKVFICTGNILPFKPVPFGTGFVTGKACQAHLMAIGALSYAAKAYRFYFASQVYPGWESVQYEDLSGEAHGKAYWNLVQQKEQGEWQVNFGSDGIEYGKIMESAAR